MFRKDDEKWFWHDEKGPLDVRVYVRAYLRQKAEEICSDKASLYQAICSF